MSFSVARKDGNAALLQTIVEIYFFEKGRPTVHVVARLTHI